MIEPEVISAVSAGVAALSGLWGYLSSRKAAQAQKEMPRLTAEAAAFSLAKDHYVNIITELEEHVAWLKNELSERTKENSDLRQRIAALEAAVEALRNQSVVMVQQAKNTEEA
ncbi:hypothetical protein ACQP2H_10570 [Micromonospora sp. CA-248260]|uniref:hypothetical protein n=1 Tax=Micromonospora sp. CA-248260 TaxID=3239962 RepID=UPI003D945151